jgi:hypothetical protein
LYFYNQYIQFHSRKYKLCKSRIIRLVTTIISLVWRWRPE